MPGNSKTLWKAVKTAMNVGHTVIPNNMTLNNIPVAGDNIAEHFAGFFDRKVSDIVSTTVVDSKRLQWWEKDRGSCRNVYDQPKYF